MTKNRKNKHPDYIEKFSFCHCFSYTKDCYTYLVQEKESLAYFILKIYTNRSFSKKNYHAVSNFSDKHILLPLSHTHTFQADYLLFNKHTTLKELLGGPGLSFSELLDLGIDLSYASIQLKQHRFFEADISPNNIYRTNDGVFCLGDINFQKDFVIGTTPYIPPETYNTSHKRKRHSSSFDKSLQFSICMLLKSIYDLSPNFNNTSFENILKIGIAENPVNRFSSLQEMLHSLQNEKTQAIHSDSPVFLLKNINHSLFETKTELISEKNILPVFIFLWSSLIIVGCFLLMLLYKQQHPATFYLPTEAPAFTDKIINLSTPIPTVNQHNYNNRTLDVQNRKLNRFPADAEDAEYIYIIYAGENSIHSLPSPFSFLSVRELYLNENKLSDITSLSQAKDLEVLCLSYNQITDVSSLTNLSKLTFLDVSSNFNFDDIHSLLQMKQLATLNISNTKITKKQYHLLLKKLPDCTIIY